MKNECYGCTDRYVGCHSKCERYADFYIRNEERKNAKHAEIKGYVEWKTYKIDNRKRRKK